MRTSFREHHLFYILSAFENQGLPLDIFLRNYFRAHSAIGSKDRKMLCEAVYGMIRWRGLLDFLATPPLSWERRFQVFEKFSLDQYCGDPTIPAHIRVSFPKVFFQLLLESLGEKQALEFCLASNTAAPTTVRVNTLKTSRQELLSLWQSQYPVRPCKQACHGIVVEKRINFFSLPEFKAGHFEIQDEGSQCIASLVNARPGDHVLDFCAGAGGKTLAIAPQMQGKGQLYLHDLRSTALLEAKKRLKRAGIQNAQFCFFDSPQLHTLRGKMDWVLVDAPCSGSGTLRRNPDMKWKFDASLIPRLTEVQRNIFKDALLYVKPKGYIVYATCSVLPQENQDQVDYFLKTFLLEQLHPPFHSLPIQNEMDGFFGVVFRKK